VALLRQTFTSIGTGTVKVLHSHSWIRYRPVNSTQGTYEWPVRAVFSQGERNKQSDYLHAQHAIGKAI
jgi:hypothetical protein